ncbi:T6SS immunity protein Tdi1 domain-containing protein [Motilimonas pumila]|uniref:DUF1851 domain-containing protein n=1 Tax=Motilimonas pumila TaxID=2303987 RepID=A0A418YFC1_9GAMM|nr:T6SS immunity protein Tdi1 domain-containing protein [Motilimonas pumila]RJG47768.1 DUF1851 domain-containing protein [Motilimonas pumila]
MLEAIKDAWLWTGLEPVEVVVENKFGNVVVRDVDDKFWRICPEEAELTLIAQTRSQLNALWQDEDFRLDWLMLGLVHQAEQTLGALPVGKKYCLKTPGVLGGEYVVDNLGVISFEELIRFSGHLAQQLDGIADGSNIELALIP